MILSFSTQLHGKPTYFVEKIWKGLKDEKYNQSIKVENNEDQIRAFPVDTDIFNSDFCYPKIHTIREDKKQKWKEGRTINFYINSRTKNATCFAPRIQVISIQSIEIKFISIWNSNGLYAQPFVKIDGKIIYDVAKNGKEEMLKLAYNDGFENIDAFFTYFNKDFTGKIIHWTNIKY